MKNNSPEQRIKNFERKQYIVSALILLIICGFTVILNAVHIQSVAEDNTRFLSRMVKIGDFREASLILQEARLSNFTMIHYQSAQPGRSFVLPIQAELFRDKRFWQSFSRDTITVPVSVNLFSGPPDQITFEYERFRLVPYGFLIWLILNLVSIPQTRFMKRRLIEQFNHDLEIEKKWQRVKLLNKLGTTCERHSPL